MTDEKLIEAAAKARFPHDYAREGDKFVARQAFIDGAKWAEKAHAPTDDATEREEISRIIDGHIDVPVSSRLAIARSLQGNGFRRSGVPEPSVLPTFFAPKPGSTTNRLVSEPQGEPSDAQVEAGAREAFFTDDAGGHIRGGFTWDTIPEVGRENYRTMVRGVLHAAFADVEIGKEGTE